MEVLVDLPWSNLRLCNEYSRKCCSCSVSPCRRCRALPPGSKKSCAPRWGATGGGLQEEIQLKFEMRPGTPCAHAKNTPSVKRTLS